MIEYLKIQCYLEIVRFLTKILLPKNLITMNMVSGSNGSFIEEISKRILSVIGTV